MPGFDGTGPLGQGPMTGRGVGFCILTGSKKTGGRIRGFAGLQGVPISQKGENSEDIGKQVGNMPFGRQAAPAGLGAMTGRAPGFPARCVAPGYINPVVGRGGFYGPAAAPGPYSAGLYGYGTRYGVPYGGWFNPWLRRGFGRGFGRGWSRGRRRGRFGSWW